MPKQLQLDIGSDEEPADKGAAQQAKAQAAAANKANRYRVLHTADWHLGKTLDRLSREEEHRRFLNWLLTTIKQQKVDCLLIAGDVFDSPRPPQSAEKMYFSFLAQLHSQTDCVAVITSGNHDSPRHLDAPKQALKALDVHVVGELPTNVGDCVIELPNAKNPQLLIAAIPFLRDRDIRTGQLGDSAEAISKSLQAGIKRSYQEAVKACQKIQKRNRHSAMMAVGHLTVSGCSTQEKKLPDGELPIHVGGLGEIAAETFPPEFSYIALGHIHRSQSFDKNGNGLPRVAYSGSPIPLSFSESGHQKTVRLLDFADGEFVALTKLDIPSCRELVQLKVTRDDLELALPSFDPPAADLETWVELIIETKREHEPLHELVAELTADSTYRIVKTVAHRVGETARLSNNELGLPADKLENVLNKPQEVFGLRLEQEVDLEEGERLQLETAFNELLELHAQQDPEHATEAKVPASNTPSQKAVIS